MYTRGASCAGRPLIRSVTLAEKVMALTQAQIAAASAVRFQNSTDVTSFFERAAGSEYISWFQRACANRGVWAGGFLYSNDNVRTRFNLIWDNIPMIFGQPSINLLQFSALMSVLTQEAGAELDGLCEECGCAGHPGLAYAFDEIAGKKHTYNAAPANVLAGDLFFRNDDYWRAHQALAGTAEVAAHPELKAVWNGNVYPQSQFSSSTDPNVTGFIQQADFYKFRGRGLIQVTWRANYKKIVQYVQSYSGNQATILRYKTAWSAASPDTVCTTSSNADWDALFRESDMIVACHAINIHNQYAGNYLDLSSSLETFSAQAPHNPGSVYNMGLRINGSQAYAQKLSGRVQQILEALNYSG